MSPPPGSSKTSAFSGVSASGAPTSASAFSQFFRRTDKQTVFIRTEYAPNAKKDLARRKKLWHNSLADNSELNMQRYRSGHNGADSKSCIIFKKLNKFIVWSGIEVVVTSLTRNLLPLEPPQNLQSLVFQALNGFY